MVSLAYHDRAHWLTCWLNAKSRYVYQQIHGDKDTFHFAWRKLRHGFWTPPGRPRWEQVAFVHVDADGKPLFIHRCRDKFRLQELDGIAVRHNYSTPQGAKQQFVPSLPLEEFCHGAIKECGQQAQISVKSYVLSCPQRAAELARTLASLAASDWGEEPTIVLDEEESNQNGSANAQSDSLSQMTENAKRLLARGIADGAAFILLLEDDVEVNRHLLHNLIRWEPLHRVNLASLYNHGVDALERNEERHWFVADPERVYGSQVMLLSRRCAEYVLEHWQEIDGATDIRISRLAARLGPIYYHAPSLVQHVGMRSTWNGLFHQAKDFDLEWRVGDAVT